VANLDLQTDAPSVSRRRAQEYRLVQQTRPRGLIAQITTLLLQPGYFFRTLPAVQDGRQWLVVAALIFALAAFTAVRQAEMNADAGIEMSPGLNGPIMDPMGDPGMSGGIDMGIPPGMGMPIEMMPGAGAPSGGASSVSATWTTALLAGGGFVLVWIVQALLLSEVSLFNGRAPKLGLNFQIAVYASVPLALMAGLQLLYYAAGGEPGAPGLTGLVVEWPVYREATPFAQAVLLSLASRFTLFWLWSLILLYTGARGALRGRWWASLATVLIWATVVVVTPVLTGEVEAPGAEAVIEPLTEGVMPDGEMSELPLDGMLFPDKGVAEEGAELQREAAPLPERPVEPVPNGPLAG